MQELAAAIAAQVPAAVGSRTVDALDTKGGRETAAANEPAASATGAAPADSTTAQLQQLTKGLLFLSESDAALEPVSYDAPAGPLTDAALLQAVGAEAGSKVETQELTLFLRNHTADDGVLGDPAQANRFKALQMYLKQELQDVKVYRVGTGPQVQAYALGRTTSGKLAGFKTVLTET
ncbi:nuclease A inhibitor family protein [Hymenobacter yonginensis]|uniref:Nuclease A inhibitor family protein n=2 Tax=Hymenobacter yonginensis TaxID=748197 RepID=A0ABY7PUS5_9BACT|nr:nuclease A inhibitor family protein [Hymenobacter yonginensis]WBO86619.1 nuclease A inhibitor family protein [Hymenobacter yonginensis]